MGVVPPPTVQLYVAGMVVGTVVTVNRSVACIVLAPIASANIATIALERLILRSGGFISFHPLVSFSDGIGRQRPFLGR
jgi:hypothetical protein